MNNVNIEEIYVWLSLIQDINYIDYIKLIKYYENVQNIYLFSSKRELDYIKINEETIYRILDINIKEKAKTSYELMKKDNVTIVTYNSYLYYEGLKKIYNAPFVYYIKGNNILDKFNNKILITGTRNETEYGREVTKYFVRELVQNNYLIISSIIKGIDLLTLKTVIELERALIAVSFSGFDKLNNYENIINNIVLNGGMIVSEFPYECDIKKNRYYLTNRILSSLADKVLVIEAGKRSKANILVDFALEQGKDIYSIPRKYF